MFKKILLITAAVCVSSLAFASGDVFPVFTPGIYVGAQAGYSLADWNSVDTNYTVLRVKNRTDWGARAYVGFDWTKYLAIETGYTQLFNTPKITNTGAAPIVSNGPSAWDTYAIDLEAKIKAPINDQFGMYGKAGGAYLSLKEGLDGKSHSTINALFGLGVYYNFNRSLAVDFSWTRYNGIPKWRNSYIPTYDLFAAGISWKFNFA